MKQKIFIPERSSCNMTTTTSLKNTMNTKNIKISMDAKVWGPHYWFVLFTMASCYPKNPNDVTKKNTMNLFKICHSLCQPVILETVLVNY